MSEETFISRNCERQLKRIQKHFGEDYIEALFRLLADNGSNNWSIAKRFNLSLIQVRFLRDNFGVLYLEKIKHEKESRLVKKSNVLSFVDRSSYIKAAFSGK